jgi:hypothetical protein
MSRTYRNLLWLSLAFTVACGGDGDASGGTRGALAASEGEDADEQADEGADADEGVSLADLDCPLGGDTAPIDVSFDCDTITVVSCKDLSNVVVECADGTHQKTEGLHGQDGTFTCTGEQEGQEIVGVWVKSGNNASGDGPGYGERFDAPEDSCEPEVPPTDEEPPADEPPTDEEPPADEPPADEEPPEDDEPVIPL